MGEASNPGPVLLGGIPVPSSDDEPVSALVLPSTQPAPGTLPTWADSDRPQVDEPVRNVRPRLRVRSVSPSILDALEEDLEVARRDDEEPLDEIGETQVDQGSSFFDVTVADSPEDEVPGEVLRRRRRSRRRGQDSHGAEDTPSTHPDRRMVLVQSQQSPAVPAPRPFDREHDNPGFEEDTETVDGVSVGDDEGGPAATPVEFPPVIERPVRGLQGAFASLDGVDLKDRFKFRACVMRTVPYFMKGVSRLGLRAALEEVLVGFSQRSDVRMARGWKLFMLLPRMMLHKPPRGGGVPRKKWRSESNCSRMVSGRSCWREKSFQ